MDEKPTKSIIARFFEFAALFALGAFLVKLGICYLLDIWWIVLIAAVITVVAVVWFRIRKNQNKW